MKTDKQLLTVQEQRFYAFWRKGQNRSMRNIELARSFGIPRQRVFQLLARLKEKGYCGDGNRAVRGGK